MFAKTLSILSCALVLPVMAQTPPANQTMGTNPAAKTTTTEKKTTTTTTATTTTHKSTHHKMKAAPTKGRSHDYAERLASLLADTQDKANLSPATWKAVANEANALANKLYASTSGKNRTAAKDARTHVREMHAAAMKGDADGAKEHAAKALPYVYQIIDATGPKA